MSLLSRNNSLTPRRFSGLMLIALAVVLIVCVRLTMTLSEGRRLPGDFETVAGNIASTKDDLNALAAVLPLPPVPDSWAKLAAASSMHGAELVVLSGDNTGVQELYVGPLKNWSGSLIGNKVVIPTLLKRLQAEIPLFIYGYKLDEENVSINFTVVGT